MDAMTIKMGAQYKEFQSHTKQPTPDLEDDDKPMSYEEESKFIQTLPPFEKITINTDYKIKTSLEEPPTDLELKPLPDNLEYVFLEEPSFLPVIISSQLSKGNKSKLRSVLKKHKQAFAWKTTDIPGIYPSFCKHKIQLLDDKKPVVQKQRRLNPSMQKIVKKEIVKLLDTDIIYPIVDSPWGSPIHCVPKKGGITAVINKNDELVPTRTVTGWQVCIDNRKLNKATAKDYFPLLFVEQMLERLTGNKYFCFLDGFSGYFQIPIDHMDQEKTTLTCPFGTYAYRRMPFRLCNAPAIFQRFMLAILHDVIKESVEVFMKDFSVFGNSFDKCLNNLDKMLQRCKDSHLVLNWEKCHFMVKEGIVLGHKVSSAGLEVNKANIDVISKLPPLLISKVDDSEVDDNFPGETLMEINTKDEPWFVDFANYLVVDIIPKGMTYQQKSKFFFDLKYYFSEEPYLFKGETLYDYYWRYSQLINDMYTIGMTMQQVQVNTKFLNALPLEWSKFVTDQGEDLIKFVNKAMEFLSVVASRFPPSNNQLRMSSNPRNQATIQDGRVIIQQIQGRQSQSFAGTRNRGNATNLRGTNAAGQPREKAMLPKAQEAGQILDEEQLEFLADPGMDEALVAQQTIPHNVAFQTEDLDAYDSDYDDLSSAKAVLMDNLSSSLIFMFVSLLRSVTPTNKLDLGDVASSRPMRLGDLSSWDLDKATWGGRVEAIGTVPVCCRCTGEGVWGSGFLAGKLGKGTIWVVRVLGFGTFGPPSLLLFAFRFESNDCMNLKINTWTYRVEEGIFGTSPTLIIPRVKSLGPGPEPDCSEAIAINSSKSTYGNLKGLSAEEAWETIKDCAQYDKQWKNPTNTISDQTITNLKDHLVRNEVVRVKIPKCMSWLDVYDEPIGDLNMMEDKVDNLSLQSTLEVLPSFEVYTPPVTCLEEV
nr:reverse transcriptase domain-containing protein [Tanacetum cinerariifolium]